jgi:hypothetical protein
MKTVGIFLSAMMVFTVQAQVNKCINPKTKTITYSDTLCDTTQASTQLEQRKSNSEIMVERMHAVEANERKYRTRANEIEQSHPVRVAQPQPVQQKKSDSYDCLLAQKNHKTTISATTNKPEQHRENTNDSLKKVNKACGTEMEMIQAPVKKTVVRNEPEPELEPLKKEMNSRPSITDCSGGTCRDRDNNRYTVTDRNNLKREDGASCQYSGAAWNCR